MTQRKLKPKKKSSLRGQHRPPTQIYNFQEADNRIFDIFNHHGFADFSHEKRQQLTLFYQLLMKHQQQNNITRLISLRDVAIKHFIDSLIITQYTSLVFPLLDVGTGAGFPGIPLKVLFPHESIILAESVEKRVLFLKEIRSSLQLTNLQIIGRKITPSFSYPVAGVITRAFADIKSTLSQVNRCLSLNGLVFLMKGPHVDQEIKDAQKEWKNTFSLEKDIAYHLPETSHQRRLLIYRKTVN